MGYPTTLYRKTWKKYHPEALKMVFLHQILFKMDPKILEEWTKKELRIDLKEDNNRVLDQNMVIFWSKK